MMACKGATLAEQHLGLGSGAIDTTGALSPAHANNGETQATS